MIKKILLTNAATFYVLIIETYLNVLSSIKSSMPENLKESILSNGAIFFNSGEANHNGLIIISSRYLRIMSAFYNFFQYFYVYPAWYSALDLFTAAQLVECTKSDTILETEDWHAENNNSTCLSISESIWSKNWRARCPWRKGV